MEESQHHVLQSKIVSFHQLCGTGVTASCCPGARAFDTARPDSQFVPEKHQAGSYTILNYNISRCFLFWFVVRNQTLFQKEDEQRRRRKSKAQFFEMIQEIRRWVAHGCNL